MMAMKGTRGAVRNRTAKAAALASAALMALAPAASAQVNQPIPGAFLASRASSDADTRILSTTFARRPSENALTVKAEAVAARAGSQESPVVLRGGDIVATAPPPEALPPGATAKVEFLTTSRDDEHKLQLAIAGHDSLKPALSLPGSSLLSIPGVVRMSGEDQAQLQLKPFIVVSQPLARDEQGRFTGVLLVGVTEIAETNVVRTLPTPLLFEIAGVAKADPEKVLVQTTSPPFRQVRVWLNSAPRGAANLTFLSVLNNQGTPIAIPLETALEVDTASGSIEGWGLETTRVEVSLNNRADAAGRQVTLHVDPAGYLGDEKPLKLDEEGAASTTVRSAGVGRATIRATSGDLAQATATLYYRLPYRTCGASLAGGLLGALASLMTAPRRRKKPWPTVVGSALFGSMVFALYVVGINILPVQPKVVVGATFVFAVSALGAWLGPTLSSWKKRLPAAQS